MFLTLKELNDVASLIQALDALKEVAVDPVLVYDSNGDLAGTIKGIPSAGHMFEYGEPDD